jgi:hypothetical protein
VTKREGHGKSGHYEVKAHGYVDWSTVRYAQLLAQRYGVGANIFGGCCVDATTAAYEEGYNAVSQRLLIQKHGKNIFRECNVLARLQSQSGERDE